MHQESLRIRVKCGKNKTHLVIESLLLDGGKMLSYISALAENS